MRKSLLLFEKLYNISSNIHQSYHDGIRETHSSIVLKDSISLLEEKAVRLDSHCHEVCFSHISLCVRGIKEEEICSEDDLRLSYSRMLALHSVFKYHDSHEEYQNLSLKLGLFDTLCQDVRRYTLLRRKDKEHEKQHIYWKLLLLLAISRRNNKLVSEVSKMRDVFVKLLEEDDLLYYVSVDILTIIYRDNRNLIVSDQENLERTCLELAHAVRRETKQKDCGRSLLKICKLLCFLRVFLIARSKKIKTHHQLILRELFNKDMTVELLARISNELALLKTRKD